MQIFIVIIKNNC